MFFPLAIHCSPFGCLNFLFGYLSHPYHYSCRCKILSKMLNTIYVLRLLLSFTVSLCSKYFNIQVISLKLLGTNAISWRWPSLVITREDLSTINKLVVLTKPRRHVRVLILSFYIRAILYYIFIACGLNLRFPFEK